MIYFRGALCTGLCCLLAAALPAPAAPAGWVAVDAAALDRARGGFSMANGLHVSIGIERIVAINGEVVSRNSLALAEVGSLNQQQLTQTGAALSAIKLIQTGAANMEQTAFEATLGGTIIQNNLSGQHIASQTVINASVNSSALLKAINFNGNVSDAIARAAGPR